MRNITQILTSKEVSTGASIFLLLLLILLSCQSCEGYRCADGTVVDKVTNLPINSVLAEVITADSKAVYTGTSGKFDVCNKLGGCVPNCKDIMVKFSKSNYKPVTLTNPEVDAIVIMDKY